MSERSAGLSVLLVGGPTALLSYGGLRLLTDPAVGPPGDFPRPGTPIVLTKLAGPAIAPEELDPIDAVLLSHDHHADNLDPAGRELLRRADAVLTTDAGAERLGGGAVAMVPGDRHRLGDVEVTAVAAEHGPPEIAARNGPVIGFVLRGDGLPSVYVSGDNASIDVVRAIADEHGPFAVAVLFAGRARVPVAYGDADLTLGAATAAQAAALLDPAVIVPVHQDGWAHFTNSAQDLQTAFTEAGLEDRLRPIAPGEEVVVG